jgi:hypothetical protein
MTTTYVLSPQPWWIFLDKVGKPMAGGTIYTYYNTSRAPRATYFDAGGVSPQPYPIEIDSAGMTAPIFWELDGTTGYFIQIFDAEGNLEREIDDFPLSSGGGGGGPVNNYFASANYVNNVDFKFNYGNIPQVPQGFTTIAPGNWVFWKNEDFATDSIVFNRLPLGSINPTFNPEYEMVYTAVSFTGSETQKALFIKFNNVKSLSGEQIILDIWMYGSIPASASIIIIQNFGTGGSPSPTAISLTPFTYPSPNYGRIEPNMTVPSVADASLGTNGDDYLGIGIQYPLSTPGTFAIALSAIYRGLLVPAEGTFDTP